MEVLPKAVGLGEAFRGDAKAEGSTVRVGGWECLGDCPPGRARWFSVSLDKGNAPWAFARGEPFRAIAALELYTTLLCVAVFGDRWPTGAFGSLKLSGTTDNQGNTSAVSRLMSTKFPLVVILMELAAQLRWRRMELGLHWAPREQNEEADALTNDLFESFDPRRRARVELASVPWIVLDEMSAASEELFLEIQGRKAGAKRETCGGNSLPRRGPPRKKLRARDPW